MTSPRTYSRNGLKPGGTRAGFTLAELLIAMVVIAILASLLAPVAFNALKAAKEGAINLELKQIEVAMEEFNNKYGFYPPSFEGLTQGQLLAYIDRMAPTMLSVHLLALQADHDLNIGGSRLVSTWIKNPLWSFGCQAFA